MARSAAEQGITPQQWVDTMVPKWMDVWRRLDISFIIVDPAWRQYENADMAKFIEDRCVSRKTIGGTTIYEVAEPFPPP